MGAMIKAIETEYNGYRFRSRLEARWAVFFDQAGITYEYEPEGFELEDGTRYLPDFYLPDDDVYVEVKPPREGFAKEIEKALWMIESGHSKKLMILQNIPPKTEYDYYWYPIAYWHPMIGETMVSHCSFEHTVENGEYISKLHVCTWPFVAFLKEKYAGYYLKFADEYYADGDKRMSDELKPILDWDMPYPEKNREDGILFSTKENDEANELVREFLNHCYEAARQARFEYGENGGVS